MICASSVYPNIHRITFGGSLTTTTTCFACPPLSVIGQARLVGQARAGRQNRRVRRTEFIPLASISSLGTAELSSAFLSLSPSLSLSLSPGLLLATHPLPLPLSLARLEACTSLSPYPNSSKSLSLHFRFRHEHFSSRVWILFGFQG